MPGLVQKHLKAMLVAENIAEKGVNVMQSNCFTVQHFSYVCRRSRNDSGLPYGPTNTSYMDFTVRVASEDSGKMFFEHMKANETFSYSFLFNASFNGLRRLSECQDALVASGYIIDLEEMYDKTPLESGMAEQMLIKVRLLLSNIAYLGKERVLDLKITND